MGAGERVQGCRYDGSNKQNIEWDAQKKTKNIGVSSGTWVARERTGRDGAAGLAESMGSRIREGQEDERYQEIRKNDTDICKNICNTRRFSPAGVAVKMY